MTSLSGNEPGVAAQRIQGQSFDRDKATRLVSDAISLLNSFYPDGALEWVQINRTDIHRHLKQSEAELVESILAEDQARFARALEIYSKRHHRAFAIYNERTPLIETQGDMFHD